VTRKRVLVTGGAGFIGFSLVKALSDTEIVVFDNFARSHPKVRIALSAMGPVSVVSGDILDEKAVHAAALGCNTVIHCAAVAGVQTVSLNAFDTLAINGVGSLNVLRAARRNSVAQVVMLSTSEVYGPFALAARESNPTVVLPAGEPRWTYAASKLFEEHAALALHRADGMKCMVVRPFNIYGPGQVGDGAILNFVMAALQDHDLIVRSSPDAIRSWCYIDDFVQAFISLLDGGLGWGRIINIGDPNTAISVLELAQLVLRNVPNSRSRIVINESPEIDIVARTPDVTLLNSIVPYSKTMSLEDGIRRTRDWLSGNLHDSSL
jgi:nucleoside-diphosphate-sugar epimerase